MFRKDSGSVRISGQKLMAGTSIDSRVKLAVVTQRMVVLSNYLLNILSLDA